LAEEAIDYKQL